ncbi:EF-hand domain-containing protein [Sorangium sp. So ce136]|uniref:EF-hand domain-containing protein n=1 Tax=Sorangium sp. So ce136 TaxID=3133284 RepID=UPI003F0CFA65
MLTQLQIQNFESSWPILDHNHDGTIDAADLAESAKSSCDAVGLAADSSERAAVMSSYWHLWEQIRLAADADADGRVSRAEYMDAANALIHADGYVEACAMIADATFDAVDADDDGFISRDELFRLYLGAGHDASVAAVAFTHVDTDGDGRISRDEWRASIVGIYLSDSPDGIGSNMMGNAI